MTRQRRARRDRRGFRLPRSVATWAAACCVAALCHPTGFAAAAATGSTPATGSTARHAAATTSAQAAPGLDALGIVTANGRARDLSIGWAAASGVVMTSDQHADRVGMPATFVRLGGTAELTCYVGRHLPHLRLAVLRCDASTGPTVPIATAYPAPGTPVRTVVLPPRGATTQHFSGNLVRNDVSFMGETRLRFFFEPGGLGLDAKNVGGAPVLDDSGQIVSTLITAPADGGDPIGTTPQELRRLVADAAALPPSFTTAAIVAIGRRAAIPAAIGVVAGIIWAALARNNTFLVKALGLAFVGVLGAGAYSVFRLLVEGPQTLLS